MTEFSKGRQHAKPSPLAQTHQVPDSDAVVPETQLEESGSHDDLDSEADDLDPETQATLTKCAVGPSTSASTSSQLGTTLTPSFGVTRPLSANASDLAPAFAFGKVTARKAASQEDASTAQPAVRSNTVTQSHGAAEGGVVEQSPSFQAVGDEPVGAADVGVTAEVTSSFDALPLKGPVTDGMHGGPQASCSQSETRETSEKKTAEQDAVDTQSVG